MKNPSGSFEPDGFFISSFIVLFSILYEITLVHSSAAKEKRYSLTAVPFPHNYEFLIVEQLSKSLIWVTTAMLQLSKL